MNSTVLPTGKLTGLGASSFDFVLINLRLASKSLAVDSSETYSEWAIHKLVQLAPESIRISIVPLGRGGPIELTIYSVSVILAYGRTFVGKGTCQYKATSVATTKAFSFLSNVPIEGDGVNPIDRQLGKLLAQAMKTEEPLKSSPAIDIYVPPPFDAQVWAFGEPPPCETTTDSKKLADDSALQLAKVPTIQLTIDDQVDMELPTAKDWYQMGAIKAFNIC